MSFRITGLQPDAFEHLRAMNDEDLIAHGARRCTVTDKPGFPDRVELRDLEPGESALLVNYMHQSADTPYRASHAIFIGERSTRAARSKQRSRHCSRTSGPRTFMSTSRGRAATPRVSSARQGQGRHTARGATDRDCRARKPRHGAT